MFKTVSASIFLLSVLSVLAAGPAHSADKPLIGVALPTLQEERWVRDLRVMQAEAAKLGVTLRTAVSRNNQEQQNSQVADMLEHGIKALILAPHDAKAAAAAVAAARSKGVPVISYDRLVLDAEVDLYISFDNVKVGRLQGEWLTRQVPKGAYVVLAGSPTDNNATLFRAGAMELIQPLVDSGAVKIILDRPVEDWRPDNAKRLMEDALRESGGKVDAVLAPNDGTAGGVITALEAVGLAGKIPVTGQDAEIAAARRIVRGLQGITIFKDTRRLGEAAVRTALRLAEGRPPAGESGGQSIDNGRLKVPALLLEPVVVDADNLETVLIDSGYLKKEDVNQR